MARQLQVACSRFCRFRDEFVRKKLDKQQQHIVQLEEQLAKQQQYSSQLAHYNKGWEQHVAQLQAQNVAMQTELASYRVWAQQGVHIMQAAANWIVQRPGSSQQLGCQQPGGRADPKSGSPKADLVQQLYR